MNLLGKGANPEFWSDDVRNKACYNAFLKDRFAIWNNDCENKPIPENTYAEFKLYKVNGNRTIYENVYFKRRRCMDTAAILAMLYPEEQKYLDYLMDILFSVLNEYTWCLPAHNIIAADRNSPVFLDLFASETGFALAEIYTMLGDRLDPVIRDRIRVEIQRRIFDSFDAGPEGNGKLFWWAQSCTNNWASVCMGSIAGTAMLMNPEYFEKIKPIADRVMDNYLSGFGEDGYCLEGIHYWHYGYGFFVVYADMLRSYTHGKENYFKLPKVKAIATFIQKMFISGRAAVSFADGYPHIEYQIGLVHFLAKEYPDVVKVYSPDYSYIEDDCGRFCLITRAASWLDEDIYNNPAPDNEPAEYYGEDSKWYVKRTSNYGFAAKAGNNNEHHNHNDVGTFVFAKDGEQLFMDLGRGEYSKQYFNNDTRYDILEARGLGHTLPFFGEDGEQQYGDEYASADVEHGEGYFALDISGCYEVDGLMGLRREFSLKEDKVLMSDSFNYLGMEDITERFVCRYKPEVNGNNITVGSAVMVFDPSKVSVKITPAKSYSYDIYFLDMTLNSGSSFNIIIK